MADATAHEQFILELINAERLANGLQPLAFDGSLNASADAHNDWMLSVDQFSHTGAGGSNAGARMTAAGYSFTGSWSWAENIAWATTRAPAGTQDEAQLLSTNLFNSPGHRANLLNGAFREIGVAFAVGDYQGRESAFVTQNFARSGVNAFLLGVAFDDLDGDRAYDVGEGLGGATVTITNTATGSIVLTQTGGAGGYDVELAAGNYSVTFTGAGLQSATQAFTIGTNSVKVDWIDPPAATGPVTPPPPPPPPAFTFIDGTANADRMTGTDAADGFRGLGGNDVLLGLGGDDILEGGAGADFLRGGAGRDTLTGGTGRDLFIFDTAPATGVDRILDFSVVDDTIQLDDAAFAGIGRLGRLSSSAFHMGATAADASDRILYDSATGNLFFDVDGTGAAAPLLIAEMSGGLALTYADFVVI